MTELMFASIEQETEHALLIEFEPGVQHWIPKSQSEEPIKNTLAVKEWLVIKNELEGYSI